MFNVFTKKKRPKKYRYALYFKGIRISKHYTKKNAIKASKKIRGSRIRKIG